MPCFQSLTKQTLLWLKVSTLEKGPVLTLLRIAMVEMRSKGIVLIITENVVQCVKIAKEESTEIEVRIVGIDIVDQVQEETITARIGMREGTTLVVVQ